MSEPNTTNGPEVAFHIRREGRAPLAPGIELADARQRPERLAERERAGLFLELLLRIEVVVEAAMGETGSLHDFCDADPLKPAFTEELGCGGDNPGLVLSRLGFADPHVRAPAT
jgi:hypothetical protein